MEQVTNIKVALYFNLHKKVFSIKAMEGENKGRVIGHAANVFLRDCTFKVNEGGRQRVLKEKRKNVHAYVIGTLMSTDESTIIGKPVYYNPYKVSSFVTAFDHEPIHYAEYVQAVAMNNRGHLYHY